MCAGAWVGGRGAKYIGGVFVMFKKNIYIC